MENAEWGIGSQRMPQTKFCFFGAGGSAGDGYAVVAQPVCFQKQLPVGRMRLHIPLGEQSWLQIAAHLQHPLSLRAVFDGEGVYCHAAEGIHKHPQAGCNIADRKLEHCLRCFKNRLAGRVCSLPVLPGLAVLDVQPES